MIMGVIYADGYSVDTVPAFALEPVAYWALMNVG